MLGRIFRVNPSYAVWFCPDFFKLVLETTQALHIDAEINTNTTYWSTQAILTIWFNLVVPGRIEPKIIKKMFFYSVLSRSIVKFQIKFITHPVKTG